MLVCTIRQKILCSDDSCLTCSKRKFSNFMGKTPSGNFKVDYWNYKLNDLTPEEVSKSSNKKFWFSCDICDHIFDSKLNNITSSNSTWCPYCPSKKLCNSEECDHCYKNSFASYDGKTSTGSFKKDCWNYEKNDNISPRDVTKGSESKFWFICDECDHTFCSRLADVTNNLLPGWCSYCKNKKLCKLKDCTYCYNKSFSSYEGKTVINKFKIECWDYEKNNSTIPRHIFKNTHCKYWFKCDVCFHSFIINIDSITGKKERWCVYCCERAVKFCNKDCNYCYNRSFASYSGITSNGNLKIKCWDYKKNNSTIPRNIALKSNSKFWFICDVCDNSFHISIDNITSNKPSWCPFCRNKTESVFKYWFETNYSQFELNYQAKYKWCKNIETNRYLPFDFSVEQLKIIFEIDGEQHFRQVSNWKSPEKQFQSDKFKMENALEEGYSIIRILQEDILYNKNDWESNLIKSIKKYDIPTVICIGCSVKYKKYKIR